MHSSLEEIAVLLDRERAALLAAWAAIPPNVRERRPTPDAWSAAEVMEHLRLVEGGSTRLLAKRLQRAREVAGLGAEPDPAASRVGSLDHLAIADHPARYTAPDAVTPAAPARAADVEAGLVATRAALRALLAEADGLALGEVRAVHMRFGEIDMYQWLVFLAHHERRHARQLARIGTSLAGETPPPHALSS